MSTLSMSDAKWVEQFACSRTYFSDRYDASSALTGGVMQCAQNHLTFFGVRVRGAVDLKIGLVTVSFELMEACVTLVFLLVMALSGDELLPDLPQCVSLLDSSEDEVVSGSAGTGSGALNVSIPAIFFEPEKESLLTSTQRDEKRIPVVFTGLAEGVRNQHEVDSESLQLACSTKNAPEPEEEQADFTLVTSSSDESSIPASQLHYKVKEMWWLVSFFLVMLLCSCCCSTWSCVSVAHF